MSIAENVAAIRAKMDAAAIACGRDPKEILLCAATKMNDADAVRQAIAAGVDCCGENRVQELVPKVERFSALDLDVNWHLIGTLQKTLNLRNLIRDWKMWKLKANCWRKC